MITGFIHLVIKECMLSAQQQFINWVMCGSKIYVFSHDIGCRGDGKTLRRYHY